MTRYFYIKYFYKLLFIITILSNINLKAQNQFGTNTTIFSGVNALSINPANICSQPIKFDLNILGLNFNLNNNHFYSDPIFVLSLPFNDNLTRIVAENRGFNPQKLKGGELIIKNNIQQNGYAFGGVNIQGPSFLLALNKKKSIAFTSSLRTNLSSINISDLTAKTLFEGPTFSGVSFRNMNFKNTKSAFATWLETGISYAQVLNNSRRIIHRAGFSLKGLFGYVGGFIHDKGFNGKVEDGKDIIFNNSSFAYAVSGLSSNNIDISVNGLGSSIDIGYSVEKGNNAGIRNCPSFYGIPNDFVNYKWRFGASLLDLGGINFFNNSFKTEIKNGSMRLERYFEVINGLDAKGYDSLVKANVIGSVPIASNKFWLIMPACISLQFDAHIYKNFYLNTIVIQRLTLPQTPSLTRMNTLSFIPRIEKPNWNICLPLMLNEYKNFNLGLSFRYKFITMGSDRFLETFGLKQSYGSDFYLLFKYTLSK